VNLETYLLLAVDLMLPRARRPGHSVLKGVIFTIMRLPSLETVQFMESIPPVLQIIHP